MKIFCLILVVVLWIGVELVDSCRSNDNCLEFQFCSDGKCLNVAERQKRSPQFACVRRGTLVCKLTFIFIQFRNLIFCQLFSVRLKQTAVITVE